MKTMAVHVIEAVLTCSQVNGPPAQLLAEVAKSVEWSVSEGTEEGFATDPAPDLNRTQNKNVERNVARRGILVTGVR